MVTPKTWKEFRETGLLLFVNSFLHIFGWAIVFEIEDYDPETNDGIIKKVYPARVKFRGFNCTQIENAYIKVSEYLNENSKELLNEVNIEE